MQSCEETSAKTAAPEKDKLHSRGFKEPATKISSPQQRTLGLREWGRVLYYWDRGHVEPGRISPRYYVFPVRATRIFGHLGFGVGGWVRWETVTEHSRVWVSRRLEIRVNARR